jgi:hypothetical protein
MKKVFLLIGLMICAINTYAQSPQKVDVKYQLTMYPVNILSKDQVVDVQVSSNYQDLIEKRKSERQAIIDEKAGKGTGEKVADFFFGSKSDEKDPDAVFIPTLIDEEAVSAIYVPGYTESNDAKAKIQIIFSPLEITAQTAKSFNYTSLKATVIVTNDKGQKIYEGVLGGNDFPTNYTLSSQKVNEGFRIAEGTAKGKTIKIINDYLARNFGFTQVNDERRFYDVKDKKIQYPEYHSAIEKIKTAFAYFSISTKQDAKITALQEAITIWEEAVKALDKTDKKARINTEIAAITYLNIAEACIWLNEFDKGREYLAECQLLGKDYLKESNKVLSFLEGYAKRYNAYMNY